MLYYEDKKFLQGLFLKCLFEKRGNAGFLRGARRFPCGWAASTAAPRLKSWDGFRLLGDFQHRKRLAMGMKTVFAVFQMSTGL